MFGLPSSFYLQVALWGLLLHGVWEYGQVIPLYRCWERWTVWQRIWVLPAAKLGDAGATVAFAAGTAAALGTAPVRPLSLLGGRRPPHPRTGRRSPLQSCRSYARLLALQRHHADASYRRARRGSRAHPPNDDPSRSYGRPRRLILAKRHTHPLPFTPTPSLFTLNSPLLLRPFLRAYRCCSTHREKIRPA